MRLGDAARLGEAGRLGDLGERGEEGLELPELTFLALGLCGLPAFFPADLPVGGFALIFDYGRFRRSKTIGLGGNLLGKRNCWSGS